MIRTTVSWLNVTLGGGVHGDEKKKRKKEKSHTNVRRNDFDEVKKKISSSASMLFQTKKVKLIMIFIMHMFSLVLSYPICVILGLIFASFGVFIFMPKLWVCLSGREKAIRAVKG